MSVHTCQCRCVPHVEDHCRNGEPDFPPEVIEKAAQELHEISCADDECDGSDMGSYEHDARAVLAAVADDLRAEGAERATVRNESEAWEDGHRQGRAEGMAEGARQVRDAVEAAYPLPDRVEIDYEGTCEGCAEDKHLVASYPEPDNEPWLCSECDADMRAPITAAREAVAHIEKGAGA